MFAAAAGTPGAAAGLFSLRRVPMTMPAFRSTAVDLFLVLAGLRAAAALARCSSTAAAVACKQCCLAQTCLMQRRCSHHLLQLFTQAASLIARRHCTTFT